MKPLGLNISYVNSANGLRLILNAGEVTIVEKMFKDALETGVHRIMEGITIDGVRWCCRTDQIAGMSTFDPMQGQVAPQGWLRPGTSGVA